MSSRKVAADVSAWKQNRNHNVLLPSGSRVTIRIPDLRKMIVAGDLPQHLLDAALGAAEGKEQEPSVENVKLQAEYTDFMVLASVVEPKLSEADLDDIPYEDKEMIEAIATRRRDVDAEGEHIAGLSSSEKFRRFRKHGEFDPDLARL